MITIIIEKFKINKMNKEQLEEYMISNFDKLSPKLKEQSILRYGEFILKENGIENYKIEIQAIENPNINGHCYPKIKNDIDSEKIILNKSHIHNDRLFNIIGTIYHECKHAIQNNVLELVKNNKLYQNNYIESLDYCKNKTNIDINFCNFNLQDVSLHMKINKLTEDFLIKSNIFYHLNISEREAFLEEQKCVLLKNKYKLKDKYKDNIAQNITFFNLTYHCNLTQKEVFDIIDKCYKNLVENKLPPHTEEGNLIATIMYDMCLVAGYNSEVLSKEEVSKLSTLKEKQKNLAKYDYLVYGVEYNESLLSLEEQQSFINNPSLLKNLSKTEQNTNHILIWKIISNNKDKPLDYFNELLKDKKTFFKQIVENETSREICSECLSNLFGDEFLRYTDKYFNTKE